MPRIFRCLAAAYPVQIPMGGVLRSSFVLQPEQVVVAATTRPWRDVHHSGGRPARPHRLRGRSPDQRRRRVRAPDRAVAGPSRSPLPCGGPVLADHRGLVEGSGRLQPRARAGHAASLDCGESSVSTHRWCGSVRPQRPAEARGRCLALRRRCHGLGPRSAGLPDLNPGGYRGIRIPVCGRGQCPAAVAGSQRPRQG